MDGKSFSRKSFESTCIPGINIKNSFQYISLGKKWNPYNLSWQYPPFMSAIKDDDGNVTSYKGLNVNFVDYIASHFNLTYIKIMFIVTISTITAITII